MKLKSMGFLMVFSLCLFIGQVSAQEPPVVQTAENSARIFVVVKNDGARFYGHIISQDAREVLVETRELGKIYIPRHEIREIRELSLSELNEMGYYVPGELFSTRHFLNSNALPLPRGENLILYNLYGPDFQFGVSERVGLGLTTSWIGYPIIGTAKYTIPLKNDWNLATGLMLGTGSWAIPSFAFGAAYGAITYGDRNKNITFSAGYAGLRYRDEIFTYTGSDGNFSGHYDELIRREGSFLFSASGLIRLNRKISLVFDSFYMPAGPIRTETLYNIVYNPETESFHTVTQDYYTQRSSILAIIPGLRFQTRPEAAFQFGFAGLVTEGMTIPIPMVQWLRNL